eukprot:5055058-Pleurochrysis_carterae.AAC.4
MWSAPSRVLGFSTGEWNAMIVYSSPFLKSHLAQCGAWYRSLRLECVQYASSVGSSSHRSLFIMQRTRGSFVHPRAAHCSCALSSLSSTYSMAVAVDSFCAVRST